MSKEKIYVKKDYKVYTGNMKVKHPEFYVKKKILNAKQIAEMYKPIFYKKTKINDPYPEAIYYRLIIGFDPDLDEPTICIQYFSYWPVQVLGPAIIQHIYDYEPILIIIKQVHEFPYKVIFGGGSYNPLLGFHWAEVYSEDIYSPHTYRKKCDLPCRCIYPFNPKEGGRIDAVTQDLKAFPISELYPQGENSGNFRGTRLMLSIVSDFHAFSRDITNDSTPLDQVPLRELSDEALTQWYRRFFENQNGINVEPFKHDVSDPMSEPYLKYKREVEVTDIEFTPQINKIENKIELNIEVHDRESPITNLYPSNFQVKIDGASAKIMNFEETECGTYKGTVKLPRTHKDTHSISISIIDNLGVISKTRVIDF